MGKKEEQKEHKKEEHNENKKQEEQEQEQHKKEDNKSKETPKKVFEDEEDDEDLECTNFTLLNEEVEKLKLRLFLKGLSGLIADRRYRLKTYKNVVVGNEMVRWLINVGEAKNVQDAIDIGNRFIDFDYMHHVADDHRFKNEPLFYRFREFESITKNEDRSMSVTNLRQSCKIGKEGYVFKKGFQFWTSKYMLLRLDGGSLFIFDSETSTKPKRIIKIDKNYTVREVPNAKKGYHCFRVSGKKES